MLVGLWMEAPNYLPSCVKSMGVGVVMSVTHRMLAWQSSVCFSRGLCSYVRLQVLEGLCEMLVAGAALCMCFQLLAQPCVQISSMGVTVSEYPGVATARCSCLWMLAWLYVTL